MLEKGNEEKREKNGSGKCCCCTITTIVILVALAGVAYVNRDRIIEILHGSQQNETGDDEYPNYLSPEPEDEYFEPSTEYGDFEATVDESDFTTLTSSNGEWSDEDLDSTTFATSADWSELFKIPSNIYPVVTITKDAPETSSSKAYEDTTVHRSAEVITIDDESGEYDIDDGGKIYPPPSLQNDTIRGTENTTFAEWIPTSTLMSPSHQPILYDHSGSGSGTEDDEDY